MKEDKNQILRDIRGIIIGNYMTKADAERIFNCTFIEWKDINNQYVERLTVKRMDEIKDLLTGEEK